MSLENADDRPPIIDQPPAGDNWSDLEVSGHDGVLADQNVDQDLSDDLPSDEDLPEVEASGDQDVPSAVGYVAIAADRPDPRRPITGRVDPGTSGESSEPTEPPLEPGQTTRFHDGAWEQPERLEPRADTPGVQGDYRELDLSEEVPFPDATYVDTGTAVAAKAETDANGPILNVETDGTQAITMHDQVSKQGGIVHRSGTQTTEETMATVRALIERVPELGSSHVAVHIFGKPQLTDQDVTPGTESPDIMTALHDEYGIDDVTVPPKLQDKPVDVYLDVKTGTINVIDINTGRQIYSDETARPEPAMPEATDVQRETAGTGDQLVPTQAEEGPSYTFNTLQLVADIAPYSRSRMNAERRARTSEDLYLSAMSRSTAPRTPEERAMLLSHTLGSGQDGLERLAVMIQKHRYVLDDLRLPNGDDRYIRQLLDDRLASAGQELNARLIALSKRTTPETSVQQDNVRRRMRQLSDLRRQIWDAND